MTADEPVEVVTRPPSALAWARALTDTQITQEQLDELVRIRLSEPSAAALRDTGLPGGQEAVERVRALHVAHWEPAGVCDACGDPLPCPTLTALGERL